MHCGICLSKVIVMLAHVNYVHSSDIILNFITLTIITFTVVELLANSNEKCLADQFCAAVDF